MRNRYTEKIAAGLVAFGISAAEANAPSGNESEKKGQISLTLLLWKHRRLELSHHVMTLCV